jgi:hypothetical protein
VQEWVASIGLDPARFGTHSLRRTKAVLIYRRNRESSCRATFIWTFEDRKRRALPRIEVDDAIEIAEKIDI